MKILTITNKYPPNVTGGAEIAAALNVDILRDMGHDVKVITEFEPPQSCYKDKNVGLCVSRMHNSFGVLGRLKKMIKKLGFHANDCFGRSKTIKYDEEIKAFNPDVCHIHNVQGIGYRTFEYIGSLNLPTLVTFHDYSLICINQSKYYKGKPCQKEHAICEFTSVFKKKYLRNIKNLGISAPSNYLLGIVSQEIGCNARFLRQWDLPIQLQPRLTRPQKSAGELNIGFIGRLDHSKGAHLLGNIINRCPDNIIFKIAGQGILEAELHQSLSWRKNVQFIGFCPKNKLSDFYNQIDVLIVPSQWQEIYSLVVREAISQGVPCIVSNRGALPDLVDQSVGWVLDANNTNDWVKLISKINNDPSMFHCKSEKCLQIASEKTNFASASQCLLMFQELLKTNHVKS